MVRESRSSPDRDQRHRQLRGGDLHHPARGVYPARQLGSTDDGSYPVRTPGGGGVVSGVPFHVRNPAYAGTVIIASLVLVAFVVTLAIGEWVKW